MRYILTLLCFLFVSELALAQGSTRTGKLDYVRGVASTTASDAVLDSLVAKTVYTWSLCHDIDSPAAWVVFSEAVDPATDGTKLEPGACYECLTCGGGPLRRLVIKAQAAAAGYSVIMHRP